MTAGNDGAALVLQERLGDTLMLTLNRPGKANALSTELIDELGQVVEALAAACTSPDGPRAVVLTGAGQRAFSAGADIANLVGLDAARAEAQMLRGQRIFDALSALPVPIIAAMRGVALGGGLELAMACDMRIAAPDARFGQPEITLGNIPGWGGTQRLPRLVGRAVATEMILTGEPIDADRALQVGLINQIAPDPLAAARELAAAVTRHSRPAVAAAKQVIAAGLRDGMAAGLAAEAAAVGQMCETDEQHRAVAEFLAHKQAQRQARAAAREAAQE